MTVHDMEKNEASFAFKQMALVMEAEVEWREPRKLQVDASTGFQPGEQSVEKEIQDARELKALSAVYFNRDDIPPSPSRA